MLEKKGQLNAVYFFSLILVLFFPGLGLIAAVFLIIAARWFSGRLKTGLYDSYEKYITQKSYDSVFTQRPDNVLNKMRNEIGFEPFIDIMRGEELKIKLRVIEKLSREPKNENVKLLKEAFYDPAADVRLYAAAALLKMDSQVNSEIELMLKKTKSRGQAADFRQLGALYQKYVDSGLIEKSLTEYYLSLASQAYRTSLDIDTNQPDCLLDYVRCLFRLNQHNEAKSALDHAVAAWPDNPQMIFLRNEFCFITGDFANIGASFSGISPEGLSRDKREVWEFWTNKG
ncbi:MAG: tetratricopeptide repeat protein [Candidatus Omnitrophica bacterium]|nr:tetratricopeptide repeat protein [Candidatus Omnitrophota bacterium]MDD5653484.1 tetratricopeptide repeat protein [Candidatus Omnitrophota bacterium]